MEWVREGINGRRGWSSPEESDSRISLSRASYSSWVVCGEMVVPRLFMGSRSWREKGKGLGTADGRYRDIDRARRRRERWDLLLRAGVRR